LWFLCVVIGYQADNEPGDQIFYKRCPFLGFVDHLRRDRVLDKQQAKY